MGADQVAHAVHLNAGDVALAFVSPAPQADIELLKARIGWKMHSYTLTDGFDTGFGVDEWHGTNVFVRDGDRVFRTPPQKPGDEAMGSPWSYLDVLRSGVRRSGRTRGGGIPRHRQFR